MIFGSLCISDEPALQCIIARATECISTCSSIQWFRTKSWHLAIIEFRMHINHINQASFNGTQTNSEDQDQTTHYAVSDQDLQCYITECYIKDLKKK